MKLNFNILFIILCILMLVDFIETVYGVGVLGYYEMNPISRYILKSKDYIAYLVFALYTIPFSILGMLQVFKKQWHKDVVLLGFVLEYSYFVLQNILILYQ